MLGTSVLLLAGAAAALDCHAQFWPEMHASPRRLDALILANGALAKLCFDADADGEVHRQHARVFLNASGLVDISIESDLQDVLKKNDAVKALVEVLFAAKQRRRSPAFSARVRFEDIDARAWSALRPDVAFDLVPLNRLTKITARRGEAVAFAARRSCAALDGSLALLHSAEDCEAEAAAEIHRLRGAYNALPAGFGQMRRQLEEYLVPRYECPAGETCVALFEGGTYSYPFKFHAMKNLLGQVLRDRVTQKHVEVCEVGFNAGHSTLLWLIEDPRVRVRAFDLGIHWYSKHVVGFFDEVYGPGRVDVVFGDSQETLPTFAAAFNSSSPPEFCDLTFVDGGRQLCGNLISRRPAHRRDVMPQLRLTGWVSTQIITTPQRFRTCETCARRPGPATTCSSSTILITTRSVARDGPRSRTGPWKPFVTSTRTPTERPCMGRARRWCTGPTCE